MPRDADPVLVGRYIPNLVPRLFTFDRDFIQEIRDRSRPSRSTRSSPTTTPGSPSGPKSAAAWSSNCSRGSSPARSAGSRPTLLMFTEEAAGGGGHRAVRRDRRAVSPTVAGLARNTLRLPPAYNTVKCSMPSAMPQCCSPPTGTRLRSPAGSGAAPAGEPAALEGPRRHQPRRPLPRLRAPDDIAFDAADATPGADRAVGQDAHRQIEPLDSIESITDGASSRRNQLLVDLGSSETSRAIDGAVRGGRPAARTGSQAGPPCKTVRPGAHRRRQRPAAVSAGSDRTTSRTPSPSA